MGKELAFSSTAVMSCLCDLLLWCECSCGVAVVHWGTSWLMGCGVGMGCVVPWAVGWCVQLALRHNGLGQARAFKDRAHTGCPGQVSLAVRFPGCQCATWPPQTHTFLEASKRCWPQVPQRCSGSYSSSLGPSVAARRCCQLNLCCGGRLRRLRLY